MSGDYRDTLAQTGSATAEFILDGLFSCLEEDRYYCVVDHPTDIPTVTQLEMRMQDQITGRRPRAPEQLGSVLKVMDLEKYKAREKKVLGATAGAKL